MEDTLSDLINELDTDYYSYLDTFDETPDMGDVDKGYSSMTIEEATEYTLIELGYMEGSLQDEPNYDDLPF